MSKAKNAKLQLLCPFNDRRQPEIREPAPRKQKLVPGKDRETGKPGREGMRHLATWVPEDDWRWLRQEAFDSETTMGALMTEALKLLRSKRDK